MPIMEGVFAKGCEPVEFGNFKRIDNDYYCTVDKAVLAEGGPLTFLLGGVRTGPRCRGGRVRRASVRMIQSRRRAP
jgi:hypothetical protein